MSNRKAIKEFLKPDRKKVIVVLILTIISYFFKADCLPSGMLGVCEEYGFPFSFLIMGSGDFAYLPQYIILWPGLIADLIFWYFIVSVIIFIIKLEELKFKKTHKNIKRANNKRI